MIRKTKHIILAILLLFSPLKIIGIIAPIIAPKTLVITSFISQYPKAVINCSTSNIVLNKNARRKTNQTFFLLNNKVTHIPKGIKIIIFKNSWIGNTLNFIDVYIK